MEPRQVRTYRRARFLIQDEIPFSRDTSVSPTWSSPDVSYYDGHQFPLSPIESLPRQQLLSRTNSISSDDSGHGPSSDSALPRAPRQTRNRACTTPQERTGERAMQDRPRPRQPVRQLSRSISMEVPQEPSRRTSRETHQFRSSRPTRQVMYDPAVEQLADMYHALHLYESTRRRNARRSQPRHRIDSAMEAEQDKEDTDDSTDSYEEIMAQLSTPSPR